MLWLAHTGTFGEVQAFGAKRNDFLATCTSIPKAPEPDYLWAAAVCATCAPSLGADPARRFRRWRFRHAWPRLRPNRLTREERNSLLWGGIATVSVAAGDVVQIERQVTMYRQNVYGESDPSYLDVETIYTSPGCVIPCVLLSHNVFRAINWLMTGRPFVPVRIS
ncbi:phage tail sheath subtilisin-like domain-containing protein [Escherichia coli]|uniref:phage tail sheath subtilisin-like domain-containing protein n=1 Tax=Escherichia coli TaxID=562 RepID=UPI0004D51B0E|nr:phage tail sheath subtilisin-like domain-containing protein [Escherichia coli]KDV70624.1 hypothetical protein BU63_28580 [Escherichia coli O118:H16 str. 07-4255]